ncbi:MAG: radical SAM protein [uncultured bacterium]|nr:MAG: radical SAM protein [uncultured bacterium]
MKIILSILPLFWPELPPLGAFYIKGFLSDKNIDCKVIDYNNFFFSKVSKELQKEWKQSCNHILENQILNILKTDFKDDFEEMLTSLSSYDIAGFTCYKSNFDITIEIINLVKKRNPDIKIILGGPQIAGLYFKHKNNLAGLYPIVDHFVIGEGENSVYEILKNIKTDKIFVFNETAHSFSPDFSDINLNDYPRKSSIPVLLSRGCIKKCRFCSERLLYRKYKTLNIENLIEQIKSHSANGILNFIFFDSLINGNLKILEEFCDSIIFNFGSIKWEAQLAIRTDMPEELFKKIKQSGCYHLFIGLESGSDDTLKRMNKGYSSNEALSFFEKLKMHDLSFGVSLITGFPGETEHTFKESLDFIINNKHVIPKIEQINPFVYYNGIPLSEEESLKSADENYKRAIYFIEQIKKAGIKHTKAYLLNLIGNQNKLI